MFEIERVRDRERKIGHSLHKGTETLVRDRERFEIEGVLGFTLPKGCEVNVLTEP